MAEQTFALAPIKDTGYGNIIGFFKLLVGILFTVL